MYLREGRGFRPHLDLRLDEPTLLRKWFQNLPIPLMNRNWGLNDALGETWRTHFNERILAPNYQGGRIQPNGTLSGGTVAGPSLSATARKWDDWMESSSDPSLFESVKLEEFGQYGDPLGGLLLAPDVYCFECDELEPAWLYSGDQRLYSNVHENYRTMITGLLNHGLFGYHPELSKCPKCHPDTRFITPSFAGYARRKPGMCECMPCRRSL